MSSKPYIMSSDELSKHLDKINLGGSSETNVHKIVVGVDFGTTYTGVSWISSAEANKDTLDVHCIRDWPGPGRDADYSWKTPSRIAYGSENKSNTNSWGFEVLPRMKAYSWFKLLLDPEKASKFDFPTLATSEGKGVLAKPEGKKAVDICADYLGQIAMFTYNSIMKRVSAETLAATPLEFWFSVPAVWSDKAKSDTLHAAYKAANIAKIKCHPDSKIFLIPEPEAAAIATLFSLKEGLYQYQVKPGDGILVCDCGGGTVDITTYEITAINPKLQFKELLVGTGGKCGSTYIDREFVKWMEKKFGNAYKNLSWEKRGPASRLMKEFENHKRDFGKSNDPSRYYEMTCLMKDAEESTYYDEDSGLVRIYEDDLRRLFQPIVLMIIALLQSQIDAEKKQSGKLTIKTVVLVGGFGDSAYLNDTIREWCRKNKLRLICPEHPQAAIVRGAALSGLHHVQPTSRRARRHYGFLVSHVFDPSIHREEDKFYSVYDGKAMSNGCFTWELAKGAMINEDTTISTRINYEFQCECAECRKKEVEVYSSDSDHAPAHRRFPGSKRIASFKVDFTGVDLTQFPSKVEKGVTARQVGCEYRIHFGARRGILTFSCTLNGKEIGETSVTFDGSEGTSDVGLGTDTFNPACSVQ